jgi:uncharacterized membrane protein
MHMENMIEIRSEIDPIFEMAAAIETWPSILPHYRSVDILRQTSVGRLANMSAWRGRVPVQWQAWQGVDSDRMVVSFHHTRGFTKGMEVFWSFHRLETDGRPLTRVVISHDLAARSPAMIFRVVNRVIGQVFIEYIATKTLLRVKELAEARSHAPA